MKPHTFAICAYRDSPYLESCLKSLKRQSIPTDVILCTSTPSTYIETLAGQYQIPIYVREGSSDIRDDWNYAYHMAEGEFVTIAHQDDMYHKDYVKNLLNYAVKYPDMTLFTSDYITVKDRTLQKKKKVERVKTLLRLPLRIPSLNHITGIKKSVLMMGNSICCPACSYQKKRLEDPLFTSAYKYALDWDTLLKLADLPGRFICAEKPLMYYRIHDGATTKECIRDHRRAKEEAEMFCKFWPKPMVRLILHYYQRAYAAYD